MALVELAKVVAADPGSKPALGRGAAAARRPAHGHRHGPVRRAARADAGRAAHGRGRRRPGPERSGKRYSPAGPGSPGARRAAGPDHDGQDGAEVQPPAGPVSDLPLGALCPARRGPSRAGRCPGRPAGPPGLAPGRCGPAARRAGCVAARGQCRRCTAPWGCGRGGAGHGAGGRAQPRLGGPGAAAGIGRFSSRHRRSGGLGSRSHRPRPGPDGEPGAAAASTQRGRLGAGLLGPAFGRVRVAHLGRGGSSRWPPGAGLGGAGGRRYRRLPGRRGGQPPGRAPGAAAAGRPGPVARWPAVRTRAPASAATRRNSGYWPAPIRSAAAASRPVPAADRLHRSKRPPCGESVPPHGCWTNPAWPCSCWTTP